MPPTRSRPRRAGAVLPLILLGCGAAAAWGDAEQPAAAISPDARPALILQLPTQALMLVHRTQPLPAAAQSPVSRRSREPLPPPWRTAAADRGFAASLLAPLRQPAANWPWRSLAVAASSAQARRQAQSAPGQDAVVVALHPQLTDLSGRVEFSVQAEETVVRAAGTPQERRRRTRLQYFTTPFQADSTRPRRYAAAFAAGGRLDQRVAAAAVDLGRFLAFAVTQVAVPSQLRPRNRTLAQLHVRLSCSVCRAGDPVLYEQPGRIWLQSTNEAGTILSLPLQ